MTALVELQNDIVEMTSFEAVIYAVCLFDEFSATIESIACTSTVMTIHDDNDYVVGRKQFNLFGSHF